MGADRHLVIDAAHRFLPVELPAEPWLEVAFIVALFLVAADSHFLECFYCTEKLTDSERFFFKGFFFGIIAAAGPCPAPSDDFIHKRFHS
jgi:hypothetical protein